MALSLEGPLLATRFLMLMTSEPVSDVASNIERAKGKNQST